METHGDTADLWFSSSIQPISLKLNQREKVPFMEYRLLAHKRRGVRNDMTFWSRIWQMEEGRLITYRTIYLLQEEVQPLHWRSFLQGQKKGTKDLQHCSYYHHYCSSKK